MVACWSPLIHGMMQVPGLETGVWMFWRQLGLALHGFEISGSHGKLECRVSCSVRSSGRELVDGSLDLSRNELRHDRPVNGDAGATRLKPSSLGI
jgi:hypothetical protein